MKFNAKTCLATLTATVLFSLSTISIAKEDHHPPPPPPLPNGWSYYNPTSTGSGSNASSNTFLSAGLVGATGFAGTGSITYRSNGTNGSLHAKIQLPVDGTTILDSNTAASTSYTLTISSGSSTIATCTLNINDIGFTSSNTTPVVVTEVANYEVSIYEQNTTIVAPIGTCTNGTSATAELPVLSATDTVSVALSTTPTSPILTGTLGATVTHHH